MPLLHCETKDRFPASRTIDHGDYRLYYRRAMHSKVMPLRILALAVLFSAVVPSFPQGPVKAQLQGVVKRAGTDEPIAGARVTVSRNTSPIQQVDTTATDEKGS